MKKILIASIVPVLMGTTFSAFAEDLTPKAPKEITVDGGKINFTGKVIANACTFDSLSSDINPKLSDISDRDITGVGKIGGNKRIKIVLKDCGADVKKVEVKAEGTADTNDSKAFKNISTPNAAKGVGIYLYKNDTGDEKFDPQGSIKKSYDLTKNQDTTLIFRAAYVGTSAAVVAGNVQSTVTLTMTYM